MQGEELIKAKDLRQQGVESQGTVRRAEGSSRADKNINEKRRQQEEGEETILTMGPSASSWPSFSLLEGFVKR